MDLKYLKSIKINSDYEIIVENKYNGSHSVNFLSLGEVIMLELCFYFSLYEICNLNLPIFISEIYLNAIDNINFSILNDFSKENQLILVLDYAYGKFIKDDLKESLGKYYIIDFESSDGGESKIL